MMIASKGTRETKTKEEKQVAKHNYFWERRMWLPGWDSIGGSGAWATFWAWACVVCVCFSALTQFAYQLYSGRNSMLIEIAAREADAIRKGEKKEADDQISGLKRQLSEAEKKVDSLQKGVTHRNLRPEQKRQLIEALRPFAGQKVAVVTVMGSDDGLAFANDFMEVFRGANWNIDPGSPSQAVYGDKTPVGLEPTMNQAEAEAHRIPNSFAKLIETLAALNLAQPKSAFVNPTIPIDQIEMRIGVRPARR